MSSRRKRIAILGAGAVGGYVGGLVALGGADVRRQQLPERHAVQ